MIYFAIQGSSVQWKIQKSFVQRASVAETVPKRLSCFLLHLPAEEHMSNQPAVSAVGLTQRSSQKTHKSHHTPTYTQRCSKQNAVLSSRRDWKIENSTRSLQEPPVTVFLLPRRSVTPQHSGQ